MGKMSFSSFECNLRHWFLLYQFVAVDRSPCSTESNNSTHRTSMLINSPLLSNLPSEDEARSILDAVIANSQAEGVFVSLNASTASLSRFSGNQIGQNVSKNRCQITITSNFGQRSASASTTELEPDAILATLRRSEELAGFAPEDPEFMPLLPPQTYKTRQAAFDEATADFSPLAKGEMIENICQTCAKLGIEGAGTLSSGARFTAIANSLGLSAFDRETEADFSFTAKIADGSSWSNRTAWSMAQLPIAEITEKTSQKALLSRNPRTVDPANYPVVMEAAALAGLLPWVIWNLDARAADEGRSFMSRTDTGGEPQGNRLGEALFSPLVNVRRDPSHPLLQTAPFFDNGLSNDCRDIIADGIPQSLSYSRYWAKEKGVEPTGGLSPIVMSGTAQTTEDLIAQTERGILVSRAWYVRYVNPRTLEVTGMTRDGTFWIEDGKIAYPIKNLRFNQQLPEMLAGVTALGDVERFDRTVVPSVKVDRFHFSSITDSI
jgi:predicted Zn-dependent protease